MSGDVRKKGDLLEELEKLCRSTPFDQRDGNEQIQAVRQQLYDRNLSAREMGRLKALEAEYNLA